MSLTEDEWALLEKACATVPPMAMPPAVGSDRDYPDYVTNQFLTVLDLRLINPIVKNAITYYENNRWDEVRSLADLEAVLGRHPNDPVGNRDAAKYLWGYAYGDRLGWLRGLVRWAREMGLTNQDRLRDWAHESDFERDFAWRTKGLGIAAYSWLVMRLGVDTVKPDVMVHRFVTRVLGRDLGDLELIHVITKAAHRVGRSARELDGAIWEYERGGPGAI
ncbi:MAG: hypothetical protein M3Q23_08595 [Actinomycetota bacterium]|nr:hypothetical protein [Actinomycetota bacterium]